MEEAKDGLFDAGLGRRFIMCCNHKLVMSIVDRAQVLGTAHMESAFGLTDVQGQGKERE